MNLYQGLNMTKRKILIIGVGGIGSYLVQLLNQTEQYEIWIADPDKVEKKNLSYQNFLKQDVSKHKVAGIMLRMASVKGMPYPILAEKQLLGYDLVICCADNLDVRRAVYRLGFANKCRASWVDLRAQGRNGAMISYKTEEKLSDTFLSGPTGSFSCQGEDFNNSKNTKDLHFTHVAIAGVGAQWIQRWFNGDEVTDKLFLNI